MTRDCAVNPAPSCHDGVDAVVYYRVVDPFKQKPASTRLPTGSPRSQLCLNLTSARWNRSV